jgi:hypothetical protein
MFAIPSTFQANFPKNDGMKDGQVYLRYIVLCGVQGWVATKKGCQCQMFKIYEQNFI